MLRRNWSRFVSRFTIDGFRSDIRSRTTGYAHEASEGIINQAHLKYSVQVYKKTLRYLGTVGGTIRVDIE